MVARISTPSNIQRALNYNEQKVSQGQAELLQASGYLKAFEDMNFYEKLEGFTRLIERNSSKTNSLHISLNFAESDVLDKEKLVQIADDYMDKIGFAAQPYLVYQHYDAGHQHVHIVTTSIRTDGTRINTFNIGQNQSEKARKEIELAYGLVIAGEQERKQAFRLKPVNAEKVSYGKSQTKRAITNVLDAVLKRYHYTSLAELNAVLRLYNVLADQGGNDSRVFQNGGLVYRVLDERGDKIGVPVKASDIYSKPTLTYLKERFNAGEAARLPHRNRIKNHIDIALLNRQLTLPALMRELRGLGINTILRKSEQGQIYGITFIDYETRCVFNGRDLGKDYSAKALMSRCAEIAPRQQHGQHIPGTNLMEILLGQSDPSEALPFELKRTKKKKRKQIQSP